LEGERRGRDDGVPDWDRRERGTIASRRADGGRCWRWLSRVPGVEDEEVAVGGGRKSHLRGLDGWWSDLRGELRPWRGATMAVETAVNALRCDADRLDLLLTTPAANAALRLEKGRPERFDTWRRD
jgi:hypothetical protein